MFDTLIDKRTIEYILTSEFEAIKKDLIDKHIELGMKASGNWINNLSIEITDGHAIIWGADYTEQLVNGREPGKFPPISAIRKWIDDKPIIADNIKPSVLAFLIARKIAREGTEYYKQGGTELIEAVITPERIQRIINRVGSDVIKNIFVKLRKELN